jgi:hypothetical protein
MRIGLDLVDGIAAELLADHLELFVEPGGAHGGSAARSCISSTSRVRAACVLPAGSAS